MSPRRPRRAPPGGRGGPEPVRGAGPCPGSGGRARGNYAVGVAERAEAGLGPDQGLVEGRAGGACRQVRLERDALAGGELAVDVV
ncbi:MAG: hypothetical protein M3Z75_25605 [Actinomycetota bacterium]|nr:hypothetical protein [Actinomycetota bacterium]